MRSKKQKKNILNKIVTKSLFARILSLSLAFSLSLLSLSPATQAYYSDTEVSVGNIWTAAIVDLILNNQTFAVAIGPEALGEKSHASVAMPNPESLPMKYVLSNSVLNEDDGLCAKLFVEAKLNGSTKYSGPFSALINSTTTTFGTWEFRFDMPPSVSANHGDVCSAETLLSAWRVDTETPTESVFTDTEKVTFNFSARMVLLNEIYPRPGGGEAPKNREYIELYNNGNTNVDVLGWKVSDIAGSSEVFYTISTTTGAGKAYSLSGSTIIPANGYLLLNMNDSSTLNNSGDTVRLYDNNDVLQDMYTYSSVPEGKSIVRFPDGIGFWIDPEPTPGEANQISITDLEEAGFNEETIRQILALAEMKNVTLTYTEEEGNIQKNPNEIAEDLELPEVLEEFATTTIQISEEIPDVSTSTEEVAPTPEVVENIPEIIEVESEEPEEVVVESTEPNLVQGSNEIPEEVVEDLEPDTVVSEISENTENAEIPPYKEEETVDNLESSESLKTEEDTESPIIIEEVVAKEEDVVVEVIMEVLETPVTNEN